MNRSARLIMGVLLLGLPVLHSACTTQPEREAELLRIELFPSTQVTPRNVEVWLPPGYDESGRYPVLYMHDGQMLFDSTSTWNGQEWGVDETASRLIADGRLDPFIVVAPWNISEERHSDYLPQKPWEQLGEAYCDSMIQFATRFGEGKLFSGPVQSDAYLRFLVTELKPYIDSAYATSPGAEHTFIAGSSMGGLISMYAICEYPDVFSAAACISTHWPGIIPDEMNPVPEQFFAYMSERLPDPATHRVWFDYGTETLDAFYEPYQLQADEVMRERGYDTTSWSTRKYEGAAHDERSWKARLADPLVFLMGEK